MLKLMKYEFRKSWFSRLILLLAIGVCELVFLYGALLTNMEESATVAWGIVGLVVVTIAGLSFIGLESLLTLHKDLNTKQSYMLFMTPNNGFQILGAKILENGLTLFVTSLFFLVLAGIDITILVAKLGDIREMIKLLQGYLSIDIQWNDIRMGVILGFCEVVISWFSAIVTGYLAIILSTALLAGKKLSGFISFVFFILLIIFQTRIIVFLTDHLAGNLEMIGRFYVDAGLTLIFAIIIYLISGVMIERKLSV